MKKIGMIGGLAWPSTAEYYRELCSRTAARAAACGATPPLPAPPMTIESLDISVTRALRGVQGDEASWASYDEVFRAAFARLEAAGAEVALIASNTPHARFESITRDVRIEVVSILEATAATAARLGARRALVLGTPVTMHDTGYARALEAGGVTTLANPDEEAVEALARIIDVELYRGAVEAGRAHLQALARGQLEGVSDALVCLACTELPLAFPDHAGETHFAVDGITYVNANIAHIDAVLQAAL